MSAGERERDVSWGGSQGRRLRRKADDAAGQPGAGVAGGLGGLSLGAGLAVIAGAAVVLKLMADHGAADDRVRARQRDLGIGDVDGGDAVRPG